MGSYDSYIIHKILFLTLRYNLLLWSIHRIYYAVLKMFKVFGSTAVEIKLLDSNILVKSNINLFVEFNNCNLFENFWYFFDPGFFIFFTSHVEELEFPIAVINRASKLELDFSLQSLELHGCIQFEIRRMVW